MLAPRLTEERHKFLCRLFTMYLRVQRSHQVVCSRRLSKILIYVHTDYHKLHILRSLHNRTH